MASLFINERWLRRSSEELGDPFWWQFGLTLIKY